MLAEPNCHKRRCAHFQGVSSSDGTEKGEYVYCKAFPKGIPYEIAYGPNPHDKIIEGQVGEYVYAKG